MHGTTVRISTDTREALRAIQLRAHMSTAAEAVRRAVSLLTLCLDAAEMREVVIIRDPETGKERQLVIL